MMCLMIILLIFALISFLYSMISTNPWMWFLWIPLALITTIVLLVIWFYLIVLPIIKKLNPNNKVKVFYTNHVIKMVNLICGIKVKVEGLENLTNESKVLYVANHKSMIDPFIIFEGLKTRGATAAAKSDLWDIKPLIPFLDAFKVIKINRSSDREAAKSIVDGIKYIKEGNGVILFPEGGIRTREVEQMVAIKPGAYKLALKSEAVIQPLVIIGNSLISKRKFLQPLTVVTLKILPPIEYNDYKDLNTIEIAYKVVELINAHFPNEKRVNIEEEN